VGLGETLAVTVVLARAREFECIPDLEVLAV
jgi:hypothetical protein